MKFLKRHYKLIIFLLICILIFLIYKNNNKNNINYIVLGDGFAEGIDAYGRIDYGYNDYVKDYLKDKEKLNNYSKVYAKEDMSIKMLTSYILTNDRESFGGTKTNIRQVLREGELLTISIGLNDLLYKLSITNNLTDYKLEKIINEIDISFDELIKEIRKYYQYDIYVIGYYNIMPSNPTLQDAIKKLNNIYATNHNVTYISTSKIFERNSTYLPNPNSIYPNSKGYQKIATEIISKIDKKS